MFLNGREKRSVENNCEELSAIRDRIIELLDPSTIELLDNDMYKMTGLHFENREIMDEIDCNLLSKYSGCLCTYGVG